MVFFDGLQQHVTLPPDVMLHGEIPYNNYYNWTTERLLDVLKEQSYQINYLLAEMERLSNRIQVLESDKGIIQNI